MVLFTNDFQAIKVNEVTYFINSKLINVCLKMAKLYNLKIIPNNLKKKVQIIIVYKHVLHYKGARDKLDLKDVLDLVFLYL